MSAVFQQIEDMLTRHGLGYLLAEKPELGTFAE